MTHETATGVARSVLVDIYAPEGVADFKFEMSSHHPMNPRCPWEIAFSFIRPAGARPSGPERRTYVTVALDDAGECVACVGAESFEDMLTRLYEHAEAPLRSHLQPGALRVSP